MEGRLEQENKLFLSTEIKLKNMPDYVFDWYINLKASGNSAKTCRDFINKVYNYLYSINKSVCNVKLEDMNFTNVSSYYISIKTKIDIHGNLQPTSDSYQQTVWCCLNNFFSFLYEQKYISNNYMSYIKKPKNKDLPRINKERILLTKDDFNNIMNSVKNGCGTHKAKCFQNSMRERDITIMLIFMCTGIRKSALAEINLSNIDMETNTLFIRDKGAIPHRYILTGTTMEYLREWINKRKEIANNTDALFVSYRGDRMSGNAIYNLVEKYCDDALGYHISPHKLRAGFCSIIYKETGDIEKVRRMVGHANVATTQRYIVTNGQEAEEAANIMATIFN